VVLVRILMSKSGFEDEFLIKLIVGVVKHVTIDELGPVDYRGSNASILLLLLPEVDCCIRSVVAQLIFIVISTV
jgi:hypothetical protein